MSLLKNFGKVITACKKEYRKKRYGEFELLEGYSEGSVLCFGDNEDFMKYLRLAVKENPQEAQSVLNCLFPDGTPVSEYVSYMEQRLPQNP